jgi:hypothetical protein
MQPTLKRCLGRFTTWWMEKALASGRRHVVTVIVAKINIEQSYSTLDKKPSIYDIYFTRILY